MRFGSLILSILLTIAVPFKAYSSNTQYNYKSAIVALGFDQNSFPNEENIKKAYRKLARKYHPDSVGDSSKEEAFKEMKQAYEYLKSIDFKPKDKIKTTPQTTEARTETPSPETAEYQKRGPKVAFIRNGKWLVGLVTKKNSDGSINTLSFSNISDFSRVINRSRNIGRKVLVNYDGQVAVEDVLFEFENGVIATESGNAFNRERYSYAVSSDTPQSRFALTLENGEKIFRTIHYQFENGVIITNDGIARSRQYYVLSLTSDPLAYRSVLVSENGKSRTEVVGVSFTDGSIQTVSNLLISKQHYSSSLLKSELTNKYITVRYVQNGKTSRRTEVVRKEFENGHVTTSLNSLGISPSRFSLLIPDSPLVGHFVMVEYSNGWKPELVVRHFEDGSVETGYHDGLAPERFSKEVVESPLNGKHVIVRYGDGSKRNERIFRHFEDGSLQTNYNEEIRPNTYTIETGEQSLVGRTVKVRYASGYRDERVTRMFEDGSLETNYNEAVAPRSYTTDAITDRAGEAIAILQNGNLKISRIKITFPDGKIFDESGLEVKPDEYQTIVESELVGKPVAVKTLLSRKTQEIQFVLKSGDIISKDNKVYRREDILMPVESELINANVKIFNIFRMKSQIEKVLAVFEDGSVLTDSTGYARKYKVTTHHDSKLLLGLTCKDLFLF